jgi:hypothetical protein
MQLTLWGHCIHCAELLLSDSCHHCCRLLCASTLHHNPASTQLLQLQQPTPNKVPLVLCAAAQCSSNSTGTASCSWQLQLITFTCQHTACFATRCLRRNTSTHSAPPRCYSCCCCCCCCRCRHGGPWPFLRARAASAHTRSPRTLSTSACDPTAHSAAGTLECP